MSEADLANAEWWAHVLERVELWAAVGVALTLAIEVAAGWFLRPYRDIIDTEQKRQIAQANERTEELRQENLKLEKQLRGREISDEEFNKFKEAMKGKKIPDVTVVSMPDIETFIYASSFVTVLQELGGKPTEIRLGKALNQTGLWFYGRGTPEDIDLWNALRAAGLSVGGSPHNIAPSSLWPPGSLVVGVRAPRSFIRLPSGLKSHQPATDAPTVK